MSERENKLRQRLLATFKLEAAEHIANLSRELLALEKAGGDKLAGTIIETAFREAHSFKGAARAVNLGDVETVCQTMEDVFSALQRGKLAVSPELVDVLLQALRLLEALLAALAEGATAPAIAPVVSILRKLLHNPAAPGTRKPPASAEASSAAAATPVHAAADEQHTPPPALAERAEEIVRVPSAKLYAVRLQSEELLAEKLSSTQLAFDLRVLLNDLRDWSKQWKRVSPDLRRIQTAEDGGKFGNDGVAVRAAARLTHFLDWNKTFVEACEEALTGLEQRAQQNQHTLAMKVDHLLEESGNLLMLPCAWLLDGLAPVVRDLARDLGKEVDLGIEGAAIEIDRRILTELKDPLVHMLRNCVDHGIEIPAERARAGKPARGSITLKVTQVHGNRVELCVRDDGRGIEVAQVKNAVIKAGMLTAAEVDLLDDAQALNLVFRSAVSTSPIITDLSGRGLGLAIVRDKVEKLGGWVSIESQSGRGTTLLLNLPLSRATFRGVVIREGERYFVVPTLNVERVTRVTDAQIRTVENREMVEISGQSLALIRLGRVLGTMSLPAEARVYRPVVVMVAGSTRIAFLVEEVSQEQEVLVKGLGPQLQGMSNLAGATVLGTGVVAPILDVPELLRAAVLSSETGAAMPGERAGVKPEAESKRSILVAEDSITSRTLLKNILESANFTVETAVDGVDAFTKLRSGAFDLVVSDVDMPRLNGLSLTAKIRADKKLAELPVILVTSLDSREDRERGIEVGANAYIVKRSFEQSNLLDVIRRLI